LPDAYWLAVKTTVPGVYALTIIGAAIGEWSYFILGSAVEVALLAAIVYYARTWPKSVGAPVVAVSEDLVRPIEEASI
jgi:hypothetical protein